MTQPTAPIVIEDSILNLMDDYAKKIVEGPTIDLKIEANHEIDTRLIREVQPQYHRWYLSQFEDYKRMYGGTK